MNNLARHKALGERFTVNCSLTERYGLILCKDLHNAPVFCSRPSFGYLTGHAIVLIS
jgi:hypothetical protein